MSIRFDGRVAIVTGAGNGLGRSHAIELAKRGAKVVVNDLGGARDGRGTDTGAANKVVAEIEAFGGEAISNYANVTNADEVKEMVGAAMSKWGTIDILINNAGILRDKSFSKIEMQDVRDVFEVHVMGAFNCTKAVWDVMKEQQYGRILMTTSSSGLYGNFGQANYGAAKLALVGLMNTLVIEGEKYNIKVNALAPIARTRMTEELLPEPMQHLLGPEAVSAGALVLCAENSPNRFILCAGAGVYSKADIFETSGLTTVEGEREPEFISSHFDKVTNEAEQSVLTQGNQQTEKFLKLAMKAVQN